MNPTIEQLKEVITNGNDNIANTLVLKPDGLFELRPGDSIDTTQPDLDIVVRFETFCAGNDYVGSAAASDDSFISDTYNQMMRRWELHLQTNRVGFYCP